MLVAWTKKKQSSPTRRLGFQVAGIFVENRLASLKKEVLPVLVTSAIREVQ